MSPLLTGRQGENWTQTPLENGLTAGAYAEELRGSDPRKPEKTYDQIRAFLAEAGLGVSENQVRTHFRRVGQTAPYPGQAIETTRFMKGEPARRHPFVIDHPELAQPLAPTEGEMAWVQATPGAPFIEHGAASIGMGVTGGDSVEVRRNADDSVTLAHSDGSSATAHLYATAPFTGTLTNADEAIADWPAMGATHFGSPPGIDPHWASHVQGDDLLRVHKRQRPVITPLEATGETKTIGQVLSDYQAELAVEYDEKRDKQVVREAVGALRAKEESKRQDRLIKDFVKRQTLTEMFVDGVKESIAPVEYPSFTPYSFGLKRQGKTRAAVQLISDMHIGKLAPGFNVDVIKDRLDQVIATLQEQVERERLIADVDELHLLLIGDLCDGASIYPTQGYHSEQNIRNQIWRYGHPYIADAIRTLATGFKDVHIATVPGNHGRLSKFAHEMDNCDVYLYETLAIATETVPNLHWNLNANWYNLHSVLNTTFLMIHGQQHVSSYGLPYYSISRKALAWQKTIPGKWDVEVLGHYHTSNDLNISDIRVFMNGSFVSGDEYALEKMAAQSAPSQTLLIVDQDEGIVQRTLCHLR